MGEGGRTKPREVKAEDLVDELVRTKQGIGERFLSLENARISGKFDLRSYVIDKPIIIRHCEFEDEVDLSLSGFTQLVEHSDCIFHKRFDSHSTLYKKALVCSRAYFEEAVNFRAVQVEDMTTFEKAEFKDKKQRVSFDGASFGK